MLRRILHQRVGAHVPINPQKVNKDFLLKSDCKKISVSIIEPSVAEISNVKNYMFKTFYKEAPIPIVLKLDRNCNETKQFLDKELELFINSGVSLKFSDDLGTDYSIIWT